MILYKNGAALIGDKLIKTDIVANHGKIIEIAPDIVADNQSEVIDCTGKYILPALVDIHTHGANGYDFNTADLDGMKKILFVCNGNTCRSPMAVSIFKNLLNAKKIKDKYIIHSAGINLFSTSKNPHPTKGKSRNTVNN